MCQGGKENRKKAAGMKRNHFFITAALALGGGLMATVINAAPGLKPDQLEFFETKIRPVLAQECYECHNSRDKAKSGLILDHREGLLKGGDMGASIVPGKPEESILIEALKHLDDLTMPKAGVKLDPPIVKNFEKWIAMGAPDPRDRPPTDKELAVDTNWEAILETRKNWWSFQPIRKPKSPSTVDAFLNKKMKEAELEASPKADPRTVARRLHFTITGLPPTLDQLDKFAAAAGKNPQEALDELADKLLASSQFGERWARHWMDWVRYAESHGSEGDPRIDNAHLYRDYLIRALNADVSYDQLLREHVAGDLMAKPRLNKDLGINESMIATAHWRMVFHGFAPTDALDEKVRFTDDQINVFTKAFQGLTVSCARCHNHKFDAISQADYYALFGIFGSTRPGRKLIDLPQKLQKNKLELTGLKTEIKAAIAQDWLISAKGFSKRLKEGKALAKAGKESDSLLHSWHLVKQKKGATETWKGQRRVWQDQVKKRKTLSAASKHWDLTSEKEYADWFKYGNGLPAKPSEAGEFSILPGKEQVVGEVLPAGVYSHALSNKHAARLTSKDIHLDDEYELYIQARGGGQAMQRYVVQNYPRNGTVFKVSELGGKKGQKDWTWVKFDLAYWKGDDIHLETVTARDAPLLTKNNDRSWFGVRQAMMLKKGGSVPVPQVSREHLDSLFLQAGEKEPASLDDLAMLYQQALVNAIEKWRDGKASDADALFLDRALTEKLLPNSLQSLPVSEKLVKRYRKLEEEIPVPIRVHGLDEWKGADQALFSRGDHKKPLERVPRRFLDAIDPEPYKTKISGRLELSEDLLRDDNPFTRRVIVNRIWHHVFGTGIVPTADNFGRMGEEPSHAELLDFLAVKFSDEYGWSIKKMIRYLVSTEAFRRSSQLTEGVLDKDPGNSLLTHFPVKRLEAEAVRDALLLVSGGLNEEKFGAPVAGGVPRRSVYVNVMRNRLDPFLAVYDAPVPFSATGRRAETNVPAQSLTMLNNPFVIQAAARFAEGTRDKSDGDRIAKMWKSALGREVRKSELKAAENFVNNLRKTAEQLAQSRSTIQKQLSDLQANRASILDPARAMLEQELKAKNKSSKTNVASQSYGEIGRWNFSKGLNDMVGKADVELVGSARIENGGLVVDGQGFGRTKALAGDMKAKTLQVRLTLDTLDQKAGGAMTVQDLGGGVFDAVVFAERKGKRWVPGSNGFTRTSDFNGSDETEAVDQPVTFTIVYSEGGKITGYRNGKTYGKTYQSRGAQAFKKGNSQVLFGLRHGAGIGGNRMLRGRIIEAYLFDKALSESEVSALASGTKNFVSPKEVLDALTDAQQGQLIGIDSKIVQVEKQMNELGRNLDEAAIWNNLAHSIFNLKEFIYVY